jgi:formyl-CoA transferase
MAPDGIRIADFSTHLSGPLATHLLAELGATVVKIENPRYGDGNRGIFEVAPGAALFHLSLNSGTRSLAVDRHSDEWPTVVAACARWADAVVVGARPLDARRRGMDFEAMRAANPELVYCSVSGFGMTGPYAPRGGYDLIAQGMSGIMSVTGDEDGAPAKAGLPVSDLSAGLFGAYGILCALEARERTGQGQLVDTSLLEAAVALTVWEATESWVTGRAPRALGSAHRLAAPYQALRASDGWLTVGANNDKLFEAFCRAIERADLLNDPRFAGSRERLRNRDALIPLIEKTTVQFPRAHWLERLDKAGVPAGPINTYPEALADPHTLARNMVVDLVHPGAGPIKALGVPVKLSDTPGAVDRPAPLLGQDNAAILTELGYTEAEQRALAQQGVI